MSEDAGGGAGRAAGNAVGTAAKLGAKAAGGGWVYVWIYVVPVAVLLVAMILIMAQILFTTIAGGKDKKADWATSSASDGTGVCVAGTDGMSNVPEEYREAIQKAAETAGFGADIMAGQIEQESKWDPNAGSPAGAKGIAQFIDGTWATWGNGKSVWDPIAAIDAQARYMKKIREDMMAKYDLEADDQRVLDFTLAGYNAGPGSVYKYTGIPPFKETQDYVEKIKMYAQTKFSSDCSGSVVGDIGSGKWAAVMPGARLSSPWGNRPCPFGAGGCAGRPYLLVHEGIDLAGAGTFYAATDMEILYVSKGSPDKLWAYYGWYIYARQIDEPHYYFEYHEASKLLVTEGQKVAAGTPLGLAGATGNSSGVHVHFQINKPDTPNMDGPFTHNEWSLDPEPLLKKAGVMQ